MHMIAALTGLAQPPEGARLLLQVFGWTTLLAVTTWHLVEQPNIARFKKTKAEAGPPHR